MKDLEEIKEILKKHIPELKERFGVKEFGVFGSYKRKMSIEKGIKNVSQTR